MNTENTSKQNLAKKGLMNHLGPGFLNSLAIKGTELGGLAVGTALGMRKGKNIKNSVLSSGIKGMAIGDMLGATAIPSAELYKKHKEELGTAPSLKDYGKVLSVNAIPTGAMWAGLLGARKYAGKMNAAGTPILSPKNAKNLPFKDKLKNFHAFSGDTIDKGLAGVADSLTGLKSAVGGKNKFQATKKLGKSIGAVGGASAVLDKMVEAPTYIVTPHSVVDGKKKDMQKTACEELDILCMLGD